MKDHILTAQMIKKTEIEICEFFGWNISYLTFYDHLREYLSMGLVDEEDLVQLPVSSPDMGKEKDIDQRMDLCEEESENSKDIVEHVVYSKLTKDQQENL